MLRCPTGMPISRRKGRKIYPYSEEQFRNDEAYLGGLVEEILQRETGTFELTAKEKQCKFCAYRSFCGRGDVAGRADDDEYEAEEESGPLMGRLDDYEAIAF